MKSPLRALVLAAALAIAPFARGLDELGWAPHNRRAIEKLIAENGKRSPKYDAARAPFAVFDWDQTSAFLDCGEAYFRWQLWNLELRLTPDEMRALLKDEIDGVTTLSLGPNRGSVELAKLDRDVVADWTFIRAEYSGFGGKRSLDEIRATPEFLDFVTKLPFLYEGYCDSEKIGARYAYPWVLFFLANYTPDEVQRGAKDAIDASLADALEKRTWRGPAKSALAREAPPVEYEFRSGLRVHPEMQELMASFRSDGIDVYVVTASLEQVVEVFAGVGRYGYNVPADHVVGMELETKGGRFAPAYRAGWPITNRQGKVDAIRARLGARGEPIFAAGDSDGDVEMLTAFAGTKLSLVMNRVKGGDIGKLCRLAAEQKDAASPRFILQGRNENTGLFIPRSETISLGMTEARLLAK